MSGLFRDPCYRLAHVQQAFDLARLLSVAEGRRWYCQCRKVIGSGCPEWYIVTPDVESSRDPIVMSVTRWENGQHLPDELEAEKTAPPPPAPGGQQ